ncbi:MAG TPA: MBL fold metallo-hydrolase [Desulfomonilaceae bacterium]|nr:MBL fold metallo-hydrolase [Desulfomonilaceae bacterium]
MSFQETQLQPDSKIGSGGVRRFVLNGQKMVITQITTFCPDVIGPGPVHLYLIESDALVLLDAGLPTDLAKSFFYYWRNQPMPREVEELEPDFSERQFNMGLKLAGYDYSDIDLLVISHGHPDHFLLAHSVLSRSKASVSAHVMDTPTICNPWGLLNGWFSRQQQMAATGMPEPWSGRESVRAQLLQGLDLESMNLAIRVNAPFLTSGPVKIDGIPVKLLEVRHLPGHSAGSIGLIAGEGNARVLMCGDVLLNPITPHPDDLLVYLRTLEELSQAGDTFLVLPAHGEPVRSLSARVSFLQEHHRRRLKLTYEALTSPKRVWDIATMGGYFDTYVDPDRFNPMAGMEVIAHIELLKMVEAVRRTEIRDQVHYFQNSTESFEKVYCRVMELVKMKPTTAIMRY